jgi:hypothetical protein
VTGPGATVTAGAGQALDASPDTDLTVWLQSDKISHIDMENDHIDTVISITHIPYRCPRRYLNDVRSPVSISHIDLPYRYRIIVA